ncbi:MAG: HAD hydrolase-like protein [Alphaproteobacteria bacterium]|nr:HAD hydrolase-like protein [Alphaproteobacteria bacterium]
MRFSRRGVLPALAGSLVAGGAAAQPSGSASPIALKLVVLDIGGTLIGDHGEVPDAMLGAFSRKGITITPQEFSGWRGASKRGMVKHFVEDRGPANGRTALEEAIYADFTATVSKAYQNVQPIPGAEKVLQELAAMKLLLATTTGFDRPLTTQVLSHLGWQHYFVASITSDDVVDGRPAPYMLFRAMEAAHVNDTAQVLAVGDTVLDLQAGNNGGMGAVVGVYSGAATESRLREEKSSAVLPSVAELPALIRKGLPRACR